MKYTVTDFFYCVATGILSAIAAWEFTHNFSGSVSLGTAVTLLAIGIRATKY